MDVRPATRDDLPEIERVGIAACADAFAGVVPAEVARAEHERLLPPRLLKELLLRGDLIVGSDAAGRIEAFVAVVPGDGTVEFRSAVAPVHPSRCLSASPFVVLLRKRGWSGPVTSDAVLGNLLHEEFLERAGFSPGEVFDEVVLGHPIVRRRWWLPGRTERAAG